MQVFVLGMHRSGTSALTGLLAMMGFHVGEPQELMPAKPDNPRGFWERQAVSDLHQQILAELGVHWDAPGGFDLDRLPAQAKGRFEKEISEQIGQLDRHSSWVLKDPLLCLTLPMWLDVASKPVAILIHRSPLEVAESLRRRNGLALGVGVALWEYYTLSALEHTRDLPRLLVHHRQLLQDPVRELESVAEILRGVGAAPTLPSAAEIGEFIDPSLYRSKRDETELSDYLNSERATLLESIESRAAMHEELTMRSLSRDAKDLLEVHGESLVLEEKLTVTLRERNALFEEKEDLLDEMQGVVMHNVDLFEEKKLHLKELEAVTKERERLFEEKNRLLEEQQGLSELSHALFEEKNRLLEESRDLLESRHELFEERNRCIEEIDRLSRLLDSHGIEVPIGPAEGSSATDPNREPKR